MSSTTQTELLVLVTGLTGFFAAHVLDSLLASSSPRFRVRGTLRSLQSKGNALLERFSEEDRARIELVEVKDTASSDLSEALKDVSFVLHTASPYQLNVSDPVADLLQPALSGTLNVLEYAAKSPTVRFVGITSSFAAVTDLSAGGPNRPGFTYRASDWNPAGWDEAVQFGGAGAFAYSASKKVAEEAAWNFVRDRKPHFEIATFNPPMIYGPSRQPGITKSSLNTSSKTIYGLISSAPQMPEDRLPLYCHARDVADAHVLAMTHLHSGAGGKRYLLHGGTFTWAMAVAHLAKTRPELRSRLPRGWEEAVRERGVPPEEGNEESEGEWIGERYATLDTAPAAEFLGLKEYRDWRATLDECVDDLLVLEREGAW